MRNLVYKVFIKHDNGYEHCAHKTPKYFILREDAELIKRWRTEADNREDVRYEVREFDLDEIKKNKAYPK